MAGTIRAFWALALGPAAREHAAACCAELRAAPGGEDVRWVREESLHVTLRFLGDIDPDGVPEQVRAVGDATARVAGFELGLAELRWFPSPRRPRVVALALAPEAPLRALAAAVEVGVVAAGLPAEERPFRPHLTLGRVRRGRRPHELCEESSSAVTGSVTAPRHAWDVVETVLYRSQLSPDGARYTPLARAPLGAPGGPLSP